MSASIDQRHAQADQLRQAMIPQEISQLHMPVLDQDFRDWRLLVPRQGIARPWPTRGEFMCAVFFNYDATKEWCRVNSEKFWRDLLIDFGDPDPRHTSH